MGVPVRRARLPRRSSPWTPVVRYLDLPKPRRAARGGAAAPDPRRSSAHPLDAEPLDADVEQAQARERPQTADRTRMRSRSTGWRSRRCCALDQAAPTRRLPHPPLHRPRRVRRRKRRRAPCSSRTRPAAAERVERRPAWRRSSTTSDRCGWSLLNSCEGARNSVKGSVLRALPRALFSARIPAVIRMRSRSPTARRFSSRASSTRCWPRVDQLITAISEARLAIWADSEP